MRVAGYMADCPNAECREVREAGQCKQRWHKINDLVCKFCGSYEAASRQKASGQNENDVLKLAHELFYNDHKKRFTLEHAWKELRNDQKWCDLFTSKTAQNPKRRKCETGTQPEEETGPEVDEATIRPLGVKAAKGKGKRPALDSKQVADLHTVWSIKKEDLAIKERLTKMGLLESLLAKKEPLTEPEEGFKNKLMADLMS
ncbi:glutathione S-transferase T2-like [Eutrema salsugineum]|uniref:glutathione S-transferase T2-like n=1 Tax=Eutrema salsugineum TaxID=72664 RepID=UPI000CECE720|nr:glutathione S-transferase T2-like [Eutrema salsugineum]